MATLIDLRGKVALVTGGSRGIGKAIVLSLMDAGARVAVNYHSSSNPSLGNLEFGSLCKQFKTDVAQLNDVKRMISDLLEHFGRLDILVNNAGVTADDLVMRMTEEKWERVLNINLGGTFHCSQQALRPMIKQRSGRIINISSVVGLVGNAGQANYAASKAGIIALTRSMAKEYASRGILVNAVAPGFIDTEMWKGVDPKMQEEFLKMVPLGRKGTAEEVAQTVLFLASDLSNYITGQVITVDGGMVMC